MLSMRIPRWLAPMFVLSYAHAVTPLATQFVMNSWDTTTGLPEEAITSTTQTPDGYLWLADANGLVRYDGSSFQSYQPRNDLGGEVKQEITRVGRGPDNSVWVYSQAYGLVRFRAGVFRRAPKYPAPCNVTQIQEDGDGTLITCNERVLRIVNERVDELAKSLSGPVNAIQSAARDEAGRLWIGSTRGGLAQPGKHGNPQIMYGPKQGMPSGPVNSIVAAGPNRLWVGTEQGLALVEDGRVKLFTKRDGLPSDNIRRLTLGRDKSLWVGTTKGVAVDRNGRFAIISTLPSSQVESLFEDRENNVWITFTSMNLYQLRKPKFLNWGVPEGLLPERPTAVVQSGSATWIAQGCDIFRLKEGKLKRISLGQQHVVFLEADAAGRIWVLTADKVFVLDPGRGSIREVARPTGAGKLRSISCDREGRMWIVADSGLFVGENGRVKRVPVADFPSIVSRTDVRQSRDGRLWLSLNKAGLFELRDGKAVAVSLGADPELRRIYTFYVDTNNDFWFGLDGGGLARWRNGKLARYGQGIGQPHNFVYYFAEDMEGYFWLGLRSGLVRVKKVDLNAFMDGKGSEPKESYYDIADGLRSFNFGGANRTVASMEPTSVLWFPSLMGVVRIDPRNVPVNLMIPPVHMQEVSADERALPLGATVSIPAGVAILRFTFSVPTLVARSRVQIRYRLEPLDATWHTTRSRSATYSRVSPGHYMFSVSAANNDGVWNAKGTTIGIVVLPRYYQTWWFRLVMALLIGSGIGGIYYWRTNLLRCEKVKLERRVEQRTTELSDAMHLAEHAARTKADFLTTMSHEIRTPMHGVLGTLELLSETGLSAQQSDYLTTARTSSNSLLALLNDILDLSKMEAGRMELHVQSFSLRRTVVEVTRLLQAQATIKGIVLSHSYSRDLPEYFQGDENRVRQIVFNLAGNAVKFTTEGHVAIEVGGQQANGLSHLHISVRDSGTGIPQDRIPLLFQDFVQIDAAASRRFAGSGLGLAICQRLATIMGGSISVESKLGQGSIFTFLVKLPPAVPGSEWDRVTEYVTTDRLFDANVLLAEDNRVNQKLAIEMLKRLGCKVTLAQNGREAVEMARQQFFSIILMDCQMPEMDGFEATRLIRSAIGAQSVIIALTANSLPGDRERCLQAGMNDYLSKPFKRGDLGRLFQKYLPFVESADTRPESIST